MVLGDQPMYEPGGLGGLGVVYGGDGNPRLALEHFENRLGVILVDGHIDHDRFPEGRAFGRAPVAAALRSDQR